MGEAADAPLDRVGGKAKALARLKAAGVPVPPFFVVASSAFAGLPAESDPDVAGGGPSAVAGLPAEPDPDVAGGGPSAVAGPLAEPDPDVVAEVLAAYNALGHRTVAVRSSAAGEDSAAASFAGQFATVLGVSGAERLLEALRSVWSSASSEDAAAYRRARRLAGGGFAVVVQAQLFPEKAGVLFTRHPLELEEDYAYLEANFGTGESVVGGMATPDSVTLDRTGSKVVSSAIGSKKVTTLVEEAGSRAVPTPPERRGLPVLTEEEAEAILAIGLQIEALFGCPQDIEWAIDQAGLWIVQARPQTGLPR